MAYPKRPVAARLELYHTPVPESGCWLWTGGIDRGGYGVFKLDGKSHGAHRVSYQVYKRPLDPGEHVLHKCDTRSCINPAHLFAGSASDNMKDMVAKGRNVNVRGERNPGAKLTEEQVMAIKQDPRPQSRIALDYGVGRSTIGEIKRGKNWRMADNIFFLQEDMA